MDPNWLDSPQHFVAAALIAGVVALRAANHDAIRTSIAGLLGLGIAMTAQVAWEVAEYVVRYADEPHASAYYDTIADSTNALVGASVAVGLFVVLKART
jgi:hypothetical protein